MELHFFRNLFVAIFLGSCVSFGVEILLVLFRVHPALAIGLVVAWALWVYLMIFSIKDVLVERERNSIFSRQS